jgi:succinate dehydrogenase / fumarate reductase cytochrome b subunit
MLVSILHRATGDGLAVVGALLFTGWLAALGGGKESHDWFVSWFSGGDWSILGYVLGVGLTWSLFQHMMSGIRHFFLDAGAGYELKANRTGSILTIVCSVLLTILFWGILLKDVILGVAK